MHTHTDARTGTRTDDESGARVMPSGSETIASLHQTRAATLNTDTNTISTGMQGLLA